MLKGLYLCDSKSFKFVYGPEERADIECLVDVYAPPQTPESIAEIPSLLTDADIIFSTWGMPVLDGTFLNAAPRLKVVFYGAGSIRYFMTEAAWERGLIVCSAYAANAVPVADFTLGQILMSLKGVWYYLQEAEPSGVLPTRRSAPGGWRTTVGLVSLGQIGRRVAQLLQPFDVSVIAYDPFVAEDEARQLNVSLCGLGELFRQADVVSLHTPWLKETEGLITGDLITSMKPNATLINTARGALIHEDEMIAVLQQRPDLYAVLDVTHPEPPAPGSMLYTLPNVVLTPHIAGSVHGAEGHRMGRYMVDELKRYLNGQPLQWSISREQAALLA